MDVFTRSAVIAGDGEDEDLPGLVDGVRAGRPAAVERLAAHVRAQVHTWAARFTGDADAADDVTQVVLIGLERRVRRFDGRSRFATWLFAVTRNVALSHRRRDERRMNLLKRQGEFAVDQAEEPAVDYDAARLATLVLR
jgi:RNA polymerase sigma factor (sigma-70 family)